MQISAALNKLIQTVSRTIRKTICLTCKSCSKIVILEYIRKSHRMISQNLTTMKSPSIKMYLKNKLKKKLNSRKYNRKCTTTMTMNSDNGKSSNSSRMIISRTIITMVRNTMTTIITMIIQGMFRAIKMMFLQILTNLKLNKNNLNSITKHRVKIFKAQKKRKMNQFMLKKILVSN